MEIPIVIATAIAAQQFLTLWIPIRGNLKDLYIFLSWLGKFTSKSNIDIFDWSLIFLIQKLDFLFNP